MGEILLLILMAPELQVRCELLEAKPLRKAKATVSIEEVEREKWTTVQTLR